MEKLFLLTCVSTFIGGARARVYLLRVVGEEGEEGVQDTCRLF